MGQYCGRLVNPGYPGVPDFERQAWVHHKGRSAASSQAPGHSPSTTQPTQYGQANAPMPGVTQPPAQTYMTPGGNPMSQHPAQNYMSQPDNSMYQPQMHGFGNPHPVWGESGENYEIRMRRIRVWQQAMARPPPHSAFF